MQNHDARIEVVLRAIEPGDADKVATLTRQLGYQRSPENIRQWIDELSRFGDRQAVFVACAGGEVVGWIEVSVERRLQSPEHVLIGGLVVSDACRGCGIGKLLCERAEEWTWQLGVDTLRVTSRSTREDAHRFYLRDGYREVKRSVVFEKKRPQT